MQSLLDFYPTELGHYAVDTVQEVMVTQDGRLSFLTPIQWILACLELVFFKIFYNSKLINGMLEKRIAPKG